MANVTRYDPFGDLVDDFLKGFFVRPITAEGATGAPRLKVEVSEQAEAFKVPAEVRKEKDVKEGERVIHSERYYGKVARAFRLGHEIDESKATAKYADGVLELVLPKKKTQSARQLSIQ
jgi:HSP20 family protein